MIVGQARDVARRWVMEEAGRVPGLVGAYFAGSANWLPADAPLPATSDLDVNLVLTGPHPPDKRGKFVYRGVLLEVTYLSIEQLRSPDLVLSHYHLAGGFRTPSIILDPSGHLTELQAAVARGYAQRRWVRERCAHARDRVLEGLATLNECDPFHDQVMGWVFPTGVTTHVLLAAGLENPTVRRRYVAARELLANYGHPDLYGALLELLGCSEMGRAHVERHLASLADAFDAAKAVIRTPFPFASDLSDVARPITIDGSRELIERGDHREAVFWMVVTYSRCRKVLNHDGPAGMGDRFEPGYRQLLAELGIVSFADLQRRGEQVLGLLPRVWRVAEDIMAANPEIED